MLISYLDCSQYPISDEQYYREDAIACMEKFLAPYKSFFHTGHWWCPHRPHETLPLKLPTVETDKCEFDTYATIEWVTDPLISALTTGPLTSTVFYIESWLRFCFCDPFLRRFLWFLRRFLRRFLRFLRRFLRFLRSHVCRDSFLRPTFSSPTFDIKNSIFFE